MTTRRTARLIIFSPDGWHRPRIAKRPNVCGGAACINGTRLTVWGLEEYRRREMSDTMLLDAYPQLTKEDLEAAWEYAEKNREEIEKAIKENR